jgi:hypothetical protein
MCVVVPFSGSASCKPVDCRKYLNVCDSGVVSNTYIVFLDISHHLVFILNAQPFGGWILSSSSGGTYAVGPNQ